MKILILAPPKSGSSMLYEMIKRAMPSNTAGFFEPSEVAPDSLSLYENVLAKKLTISTEVLDDYHEGKLTQYDRVVLLIRHPFDTIVSTVLWSVNDGNIHTDADIYFRFQARLSRILTEQGARRFIELCSDLGDIVSDSWRVAPQTRRYDRDLNGFLDQYLANLDLWASVHLHYQRFQYLTVRYEDLIDGNVQQLADYLGLKLDPPHTIEAESHAIVRRTAGTENWHAWFGKDDIEYLYARLKSLMRTFDYSPQPHTAEVPPIKKKHATGYVERLLVNRAPLRDLDFSQVDYASLEGAARATDAAYNVPGLHFRVPLMSPPLGARIESIGLELADGRPVTVVPFGAACRVRAVVRFEKDMPRAVIALAIHGEEAEVVLQLRSAEQIGLFDAKAGQRIELSFDFRAAFKPYPYRLLVSVWQTNPGGWPVMLHRQTADTPLVVRKLLIEQNSAVGLKELPPG